MKIFNLVSPFKTENWLIDTWGLAETEGEPHEDPDPNLLLVYEVEKSQSVEQGWTQGTKELRTSVEDLIHRFFIKARTIGGKIATRATSICLFEPVAVASHSIWWKRGIWGCASVPCKEQLCRDTFTFKMEKRSFYFMEDCDKEWESYLILDISYFSCLWGKLIMLTREYNHTQCYSRVLHLALCKTRLHWLIHCICREWLVSQKSEFKHDPIDFTWSSRYILFTLVVWWDVALALGSLHSAPECTYCIPIKMQRPNQANHTSQIFQALCNSPRKKAKSS